MIKRDVYLPNKLVERIEKSFKEDSLMSSSEKTFKTNVYRITSFVYSKQYHEDYYVPLASKFLLNLINGTYNKVMDFLREKDIIEAMSSKTSKETYVVPEARRRYTNDPSASGLCKRYRITSEYYENPYDLDEDNSVSVNIKSKKFLKKVSLEYRSKKDRSYEEEFEKAINTLKIDFEALMNASLDKINSISYKDYIVNFEGMKDYDLNKYYKTFYLRNPSRHYNQPLFQSRNTAEHVYNNVFIDDNVVYIGTPEEFETYKKNNSINSYRNSIERLKNNDLYAKRNFVNGRLDSNITNLPNFMLDVIKIDNGLESIDLSNSQLAIFSHLLGEMGVEMSEDIEIFKKLSSEGTLYEFVAEKTGVTRSEAKKGFFQVLFDKAGKNPYEKQQLRKIFPTVIEITDDYKRSKGYKMLSIDLQRKESEMFVDNLYERIYDEIGFVFTKHDSIIYRKEDREKVKSIIKAYFSEIGFKGKMEIE